MKILSSFYVVVLIAFMVSLSACDTKTKYETVTTAQKYSLDLPSFLEQGTEMQEGATLLYQNLLKEFYVMVIEDDKANLHKVIDDGGLEELYPKTFIGYADLLAASFKENSEVNIDAKFIDQKIGTLGAKHFNMLSKIEGIDIYYHYTLVEGKDTYYQVMQWTLADRKDMYKEEMDRIAKSFKEL